MPNFYIIAGCNGAGKTTASFTILPAILHCREFVNADNIAYVISPWNMEGAAIEAGRLMLHRIAELMEKREDFAIETTLATRSYVGQVKKAKALGYTVTLLYIWIESTDMAMDRVATRVTKGGHNIPDEVVVRRYYKGLSNLFNLFVPICDEWVIANNSRENLDIIASGQKNLVHIIENNEIWGIIQKQAYGT